MKHISLLPAAQRNSDNMSTLDTLDAMPARSITNGPSTLNLIYRLCQALEAEDIAYCHWKSNDVIERSASGDNDLDLLVRRADAERFSQILFNLGFKQAEAPPEKWMPGVLDYYSYDGEVDKFVHVHAHYQLIAGHDMTKNYCLPVEAPFLESAVQSGLFRVPEPEFEFIVFVIRMVLKHSTWDTILIRHGRLSLAEQRELAYLKTRVDQNRVVELLQQYVPYVGVDLFGRCLQALKPDCPIWVRIRVGQQLQNALKACTRRSQFQDTYLKLWRRLKWGLQQRLFKRVPKRRLIAGGAVIAIVGGDGAGKSTAVDELYSWLVKDFETIKVHLGKPPYSRMTITVRAILKLGRVLGLYPHLNISDLYTIDSKSPQFPGKYPWMLREVCKARDRYLNYVKAKRFAINGGIVITDRYPLPQIKLMDGAVNEQIVNLEESGRLPKFLTALEKRYYRSIVWPDLVIVLMVNPEIAVQRKTDEDPAEVRLRSTEIWETDWQQTQVHVVDAHNSRAEVLSHLKSLIWSKL